MPPVPAHRTASAFVKRGVYLARAKDGGALHAALMAERDLGELHSVTQRLKSMVNPGTSTDSTWGAPLVYPDQDAADFVATLRAAEVLGRMAGVRHVPMNTKIPRSDGGVSVSFIGEGQVTPATSMLFSTIAMGIAKISALCIFTEELLKFSNPGAEGIVTADLRNAVINYGDAMFLDPSNAGDNFTPAAITHGATAITASGTSAAAFKADFRALLAAVQENCNFINPYLIMSKQTITQLISLDDAGTFFDKCSINGGLIGGIPVIVSNSQPTAGMSPDVARVTLLDASEVMVADPGVAEIDTTSEAVVQMATNPDSPQTASTVPISLWQNNLSGIRVLRMINWTARRPGICAYINAANYTS